MIIFERTKKQKKINTPAFRQAGICKIADIS